MLIALVDPTHTHHRRTHEWVDSFGHLEWATCPLTENGFARILTQQGYPNRLAGPAVAIALLNELHSAIGRHEFWADDLTLTDRGAFDATYLVSPRQVTDTYLLALAVKRDAAFVSFDQRLNLHTVVGAGPEHLVVPGSK